MLKKGEKSPFFEKVARKYFPEEYLPLLRSDLPGYLADSEADGVCVINWYHKQFKMAAKARYFVSDDDILYFHSYMADYFLGTYGRGINKPFRSRILMGYILTVPDTDRMQNFLALSLLLIS